MLTVLGPLPILDRLQPHLDTTSKRSQTDLGRAHVYDKTLALHVPNDIDSMSTDGLDTRTGYIGCDATLAQFRVRGGMARQVGFREWPWW